MSTNLIKRIIHPRTDFPQFGWINARPTLDPQLYAPIAALSPVPVPRQRRLIVEQPSFSWLRPALNLWEVPYIATHPQPETPVRPVRRVVVDPPQYGWLTTAQPAAAFSAALYAAIKPHDTPLILKRPPLRIGPERRDWLVLGVPPWLVPYFPASQSQRESFRARPRAGNWHSTQTYSSLWNPLLFTVSVTISATGVIRSSLSTTGYIRATLAETGTMRSSVTTYGRLAEEET